MTRTAGTGRPRGGTSRSSSTGGGSRRTSSHPSGWSFTAFPESTAHDDYAFYAVRENGIRTPLTFHDTGDGMELRFNTDRLERTGR